MKVARHNFVNGWCECGNSWIDVRTLDGHCVNTTIYSHDGQPHSSSDIADIVAAAAEEERRIAAAMAEIGR